MSPEPEPGMDGGPTGPERARPRGGQLGRLIAAVNRSQAIRVFLPILSAAGMVVALPLWVGGHATTALRVVAADVVLILLLFLLF